MPRLYDDPVHETLHLKAVKSLAAETGHEFALVRQVYEVELARLQAEAQLTDYVLLLSCRRTREALRKMAKAPQAQPVSA